jgi:hypothetical protein
MSAGFRLQKGKDASFAEAMQAAKFSEIGCLAAYLYCTPHFCSQGPYFFPATPVCVVNHLRRYSTSSYTESD